MGDGVLSRSAGECFATALPARRPDRPVVVHVPPDRLAAGLGTVAVTDVAGLPAFARRYSQRLLAGVPDDRGMTAYRPATDAERLAMGTLPGTWFRFERVERHSSAARDLLDAVCARYGADRDLATTTAFVHGAGTGLPVHCDAVDAVSVQIAGCRAWSAAPNSDPPAGLHDDVPFHVPSGHGIALPGAVSWVASPGTVSFVPSGWWHETYSAEPTFALSLSVPVA